MDIMKQPLHPRVWAWLELAIEAGVDGHGPIFASASWEVANCIGKRKRKDDDDDDDSED